MHVSNRARIELESNRIVTDVLVRLIEHHGLTTHLFADDTYRCTVYTDTAHLTECASLQLRSQRLQSTF